MVARQPKMAIITRTKNRQLLLERAIKSVLAQTDRDYVHVIVNDGGNKKDLEVLLGKYPDSNRVVIHNEASLGLTQALNQGIRAVDSRYISILDDDDSWADNRIESVHNFFEQHPAAKGVAVFMDRIIEKIENGKIVEVSRNRWHEGVDVVNLYKQCLDNYLSNGCFNYTRKVYDELGGYDEELGVAEDWDFGIRYLLKYDVDFLVTEHALMYYHHRPNQTGDSGNSVFAGVDMHRYNLNILRNKYLRQDITNGTLGVGYIMNNLAYLREVDQTHERADADRVVRIEGHINYVGGEIKQDTGRRLERAVQLIHEDRIIWILVKKIRSIVNR